MTPTFSLLLFKVPTFENNNYKSYFTLRSEGHLLSVVQDHRYIYYTIQQYITTYCPYQVSINAEDTMYEQRCYS